MNVPSIIAAVLAGALSGLLGIVVYPGPLDMPVVGLIVAAAIVGSGAWAMWEWRRATTWVPYAIAATVTTLVFMYAPPADDALSATEPVYANIWVVLSALAAVVPAVIAMRRSARADM